jgi:hypothetical protein
MQLSHSIDRCAVRKVVSSRHMRVDLALNNPSAFVMADALRIDVYPILISSQTFMPPTFDPHWRGYK